MDKMHKISILFSMEAYYEAMSIAKKLGYTFVNLIRVAIGLAKLYFMEYSVGNKIVIINGEGQIIRQIVYPDDIK